MGGNTCYYAAPNADCTFSQSEALAAAQDYCRYYNPPFVTLWYNGADDVRCTWSYECCGGSGGERELDSEVKNEAVPSSSEGPPQ
jgi:hypothetical protein